jgi:hypothetical protein
MARQPFDPLAEYEIKAGALPFEAVAGNIPAEIKAVEDGVIRAELGMAAADMDDQLGAIADAISGIEGGGETSEAIYAYFTAGSRADAFKATGFATPTNVTDARDAIVVHLTAIKGTGWTDENLKSITDEIEKVPRAGETYRWTNTDTSVYTDMLIDDVP